MERDRRGLFNATAAKKVEDSRAAENIDLRLLQEARHRADEARRNGLARHR